MHKFTVCFTLTGFAKFNPLWQNKYDSSDEIPCTEGGEHATLNYTDYDDLPANNDALVFIDYENSQVFPENATGQSHKTTLYKTL